jgi:hypothetical protein
MNKKSSGKEILVFLASLGFVGWLVWLAWVGARTLFHWLGDVHSELAVAIVTGSLALSATVISLILTKYFEVRESIRQEHRTKKIPVYEELIGLFFRVLFSEKIHKKAINPEELMADFVSLTQKLIVWGSDDVIREWGQFRSVTSPRTNEEIMAIQEKIFLAIRQDLGHRNKKLPKGALMRLFINDVQ